MSALQQYIDLYAQHADVLCHHSAAALVPLKAQALQNLANATLPRKGDEDYAVSDLEKAFAPDYGLNLLRKGAASDTAESFRCDVPRLSTLLVVASNDVYSIPRLPQLPEGVTVSTLAEASHSHPQVVEKYLGKIADNAKTEVALNTLLAQDGIFVHVGKGVQLEKPVQLLNILRSTAPLMAVRRVLVVLEEGAQATMLVCDHTQSAEQQFLASQVVEIYAGENSRLDYYDIEESSPSTTKCCNVFVRQQQGSNVLLEGISLKNGATRTDYTVDVEGENCDTQIYGMAIGCANQIIDNHTLLRHNFGHCTSNQLFKYVLDQQSQGAFSGTILVGHGAPGIEAYQSNRNIVASPTAKMHTKPQLIIYTDDVKCSHGAATGQLDDDAIYYMCSRGLSEEQARILLMQAFMTDVIDCVRLDALRDRLRYLVEKTFDGSLSKCQSCAAKCTAIKSKNT